MEQGSCCKPKPEPVKKVASCCGNTSTDAAMTVKRPMDVMGCTVSFLTFAALIAYAFNPHDHISVIGRFTGSVAEIFLQMFPGLVVGIIAFSFLALVPRAFVMAVLGHETGVKGVIRASLAGVLLDLCNHGILLVGAKLYERGASAGQMMAFLISSPWNSLSLTLILVSMIGFGWTLAFIALSMVIGIIVGVIFDMLVGKGVLPQNPNRHAIDPDFRFWRDAKAGLSRVRWTPRFFGTTLKNGLIESRMILRWVFLGLLIAAAMRTFITPDSFAQFFGPSLVGLMVTLVAATVIEVCSEGSTPIAADILNRAAAPGNAFTFLMAGVATDYTEMMVIRETTKSWKIALFLPLLTVPQVLAVAWVMNGF